MQDRDRELEVVAGGGEGERRGSVVGKPERPAEGERSEPHDREVAKQRKRDARDDSRREVMVLALEGEEDHDGVKQPVKSEGAEARQQFDTRTIPDRAVARRVFE